MDEFFSRNYTFDVVFAFIETHYDHIILLNIF